MTRLGILLLLWLIAAGSTASPAQDRDHDHPDHAADDHGDEHDDRHEHGRGPAAGHADAELLAFDPHVLQSLRLSVEPARRRSGGGGLTLLGELQVNEAAYAEVGPPVAAQVVEVLVDAGDEVEMGQPLLRLRSVDLGRARADLLRAEARLRLAEQALRRKRELAAERVAPRRELEEAEAEAAAAAAERAAAEAALDALGISAEERAAAGSDADFVLRSPLSGTVIERSAVRGRMTDPGQPLLRVADLSVLWLIAQAPERDALLVIPGSAAQASFPAAPGRTIPGTVALVGRQVDPLSRAVPVRVEVPNPGGELRPGMSARVSLPLPGTQPMVTVPAPALQPLGDGWGVLVPRGAGRFERRRVERGRDLGAEVEIVHGLAAGEEVVVEGAFLLEAEHDKAGVEGHDHDH